MTPERTDARDDVLLEARLHPREGAGERRIDSVDPRPVVDRRTHRVPARRRPGCRRRRQACALRKRQALVRDDDVHEREPVPASEPPRAHVVARGDREEALAGLDDVPDDRGPRRSRAPAPRERAVRLRPCDSVRREATTSLIATERDPRASREPPVHRSHAEPVALQPELEHRDIPPDGADSELTLAEEWTAAGSERTPRSASDESGRAYPSSALKCDERLRRLRPANTVYRTRVEPLGTEPDLQRGDASTGREPAGSEHEDANEHRDAEDGEATHADRFAAFRLRPPRQPARDARLQSCRCLPR